MEKDPVCGMSVKPEEAAGSSVYNGVTYYFCSPGCKLSFEKDPGKYVDTSEKTEQQTDDH